ncbi:DUF6527 family protein [Nitrospirillum sp. BR 11164]|uniref:DUF6527 family protein n=1 Tax=Nitrospirillum sp. BR 11164 TaxID=3104324 RepID=UPI003A4C8211
MIVDFIRLFLVALGFIERPALVAATVPQHPGPAEFVDGRLLVVTNGALQKWACFRCPCGCGERVLLSLAENRRPRWSVSVDWLGRPTLSPSINRLDGCRSHFWVRRGRIEWCRA